MLYFCAGKPEGKRPLGRPTRKWEDNIKIEDADRIYLCGVVGCYELGDAPSDSMEGCSLTSRTTVGISIELCPFYDVYGSLVTRAWQVSNS
jgi:hypothetical protein